MTRQAVVIPTFVQMLDRANALSKVRSTKLLLNQVEKHAFNAALFWCIPNRAHLAQKLKRDATIFYRSLIKNLNNSKDTEFLLSSLDQRPPKLRNHSKMTSLNSTTKAQSILSIFQQIELKTLNISQQISVFLIGKRE